MEKQVSFKASTMEKQKSFRNPLEKQWSFRGVMEKQRSFRILMEKQVSFSGVSDEKKNNYNSPGKRGDSPLHLAARGGNLSKIRDIFKNCENGEVKDLITKQNLDGETCLYVAAENGHSLVVGEFLKYLDIDGASTAAKNGYDPFHVAAKQGHAKVLKELLQFLPNLAMTTDSSNSTALHTAANQGHIDVVNLLLETDSNLAKIARNNGKTALHSAARMGRLEVVKSLLSKDSSTGFRVDNKGQTALHMAVKGQNTEIVLEMLNPDPSVMSVEDSKGNSALHIATRKGRTQIVSCLLSMEGINVNPINKTGESPLDIAEKMGKPDIILMLKNAGAIYSKDLGKPPNPAKQLKQTVSDIRHDVESQLQQTRQTRFRVQKIAKNIKKLHSSGLNNAINSATVVAVLIATVAFAAIFSVPGQYVEVETPGQSTGEAHIAPYPAFLIFFVSDSMALFISLAVVVVQTSLVVIEQKAKKQLMSVINKIMWLACLFISIAFISLSYVVVGSEGQWLAIFATVSGSTIMVATIGSLIYFIISNKMEESKMRNIRRSETQSRSFGVTVTSDTENLNSGYKTVYAL